MNTIKNSKFKNTGILYELLARQLTVDTLNNKDSKALPIIRKYFNTNSILGQELKLYEALLNEKFLSENKADKFIESIISYRKSMNELVLRRQKYNIIKEIKESFDVDKFFKHRISDYKILASIYKVFEHAEADDPVQIIKLKNILTEHVLNVVNKKNEIPKSLFEQQDKDIRILSYKILLKKFNEKYSHLNTKQKDLIREYVSNVSNNSNLKEYVLKEIINVESKIKKLSKNIESEVINIKVREVTKLLENVKKQRNIKDGSVLLLIKFYKLIEELEKLGAK